MSSARALQQGIPSQLAQLPLAQRFERVVLGQKPSSSRPVTEKPAGADRPDAIRKPPQVNPPVGTLKIGSREVPLSISRKARAQIRRLINEKKAHD